MRTHMSLQVTWAIEASITTREVTFERLLSCVGTHVILQTALLRKACTTFLAYKKLLATVRAPMIHQVTWAIERFAASWVVTYVVLFSNCFSYWV